MATNAGPYIAAGIARGDGPRAALRDARAAGLKVNDGRWYREYKRETMRVALKGGTQPQPLNRRPPLGKDWKTTRARGYITNVTIVHQDQVTGAIGTAIVSVRSSKPISRGNAIKQAIDKWADPQRKYPSKVLGGFVTSQFRMVPQ